MAKKSKYQLDCERFDRFMTPEREDAIAKFLADWEKEGDDEDVFMLRGRLWDEIQDSTAPAAMRKLRDQYLIKLYKWVERERKVLTTSFPYEAK